MKKCVDLLMQRKWRASLIKIVDIYNGQFVECFVDGINFGIFYIYDNIKEIWEVGDVKNVFYDDYNNIIIVFNIKFLCWKKNIDMGKHHFSKIQ